jgi:hypothetical protein
MSFSQPKPSLPTEQQQASSSDASLTVAPVVKKSEALNDSLSFRRIHTPDPER